MKKTIGLAILMLFTFSGTCFAHGVTYSTKQIGENTIKITLNGNLPKGQVIEITSASKREGKLLNIFYKIDKGTATMNTMDVDLRTMLPPIKIILTNVDKANESIFNDIKGIYAEEYIRHLHDMGAIGGYPDGTFKPGKTVTRAEFVTMLVNALKLNKASNAKGFKDTQKHWAKNAINVACEMKIINGFSDGTFKPNKVVTTAEASNMLTKMFSFKTYDSVQMPNLNKKHWAYESNKKMVAAGIIIKNDTLFKKFNEDAGLTRADCAMLISRAITAN